MTLDVDSISGHISSSASKRILEAMERADAVLIGPGLGRSRDAQMIVMNVLKNATVPVIIDADGINAAAKS
ncbi:MAG: hypothetical protein IJG06_03900 [Clostridia bacterium]|nr:hypothetical protein [Clostridia bacterium]